MINQRIRMTDLKSTSQYAVTFKGQSSAPFVHEPPLTNKDNPDLKDLRLGGPSVFSDNIEDYEAYQNGIKLRVTKIEGNVLTVQSE